MRNLSRLSAFALLAVAACGQNAPAERTGLSADASCSSRAYAEIGGPIALIDQDGNAVTEADFKGRPSLVYFGFTYCPDVCPAALVTMERAYSLLPEGVTPPRTILISVDPERDTPDQLKSYIATNAFPDDIVGLTGSEEAVRAASDAFKAGYNRVDDPSSAAGYTMDHTSIMYLMDADWQLMTFFTHEASPEGIAGCLADLLG